MTYLHYKAINWNEIEDNLDNLIWEKLTSLFWLDTRIPVADEKSEWEVLSENEKELFKKVLAGLASAATFQSENGFLVVRDGHHTQQEIAIYNNIQFIESVHAKAYNSVLITFNDSKEVDDILTWSNENFEIQYKLDQIIKVYQEGDTLQKRVANILLEGVLNYSGLFIPLLYWTQERFVNVSEMTKLVLKNERLHCFYISHKFKLGFSELSSLEQDKLRNWIFDLFTDLLNNELDYMRKIYSGTEWLDVAERFVQQRANEVLISLGFDSLFIETMEKNENIHSIDTLMAKLNKDNEIEYQLNNKFEIVKDNFMVEEDYDF